MKKFTRRAISLLIAALMACALLPTAAFAATDVPQETLDYYAPWVNAVLTGKEKIITQTVISGGEGENSTTVPVIFHANYKEGSDDVAAVVYFCVKYDGDGGLCKLPTATDLGFTAEGYTQNVSDPWHYDPEYFTYDPDNDSTFAVYREFYFKGHDTTNMHDVYTVPAPGSYDSTVGYFWLSDGLKVAHVYANWTSGDEVVHYKPESPTVEKKVENKDKTSAAAGDELEFTLTSAVPADLADCISYTNIDISPLSLEEGNRGTVKAGARYDLTFHDTMAPGLSLVGYRWGSDNCFTVKVGGKTLTKRQYSVWVNHEPTATPDGCTFDLYLHLHTLYEDGIITDSDFTGETPIVVTYKAKLDDDATAGTYTNTSHVSWQKNGGPDVPSEDDEVDVYTYKIQLEKIDNDSEEPLAGAKFKLEMETIDENGEEVWTRIGEEKTTDPDGVIDWDGLKEGTYRLTETAAPTGYILDDTPIIVELPNRAGGTKTASVTFGNGTTPHTGGSGTAAYTVGGLTLLVCAAGVFVLSRKKSRG